MTMAAGIGGVLLTLLVVLVPVLLILSARAPVSRARVERFARRQRLEITPDNGNQVIAYLATTRRWRVAGLLAAYGLALAWMVHSALNRGEGDINVLQLLSGWFIGAVIAEARLARRPSGERRTASLRPREPASYLSPTARAVLPIALAVSLILALVTALAATLGRSPDGWRAVLAPLAAVAVAAVVWTVRRRVLDRPQPVLPPDQRDADDAIRSRSLHVLAGAGAALVLYAVAPQLQALQPAFPAVATQLGGLTLLLGIGAPILGFVVATRPWVVRRPSDAATTPAPA